jgi:hypothetical protein
LFVFCDARIVFNREYSEPCLFIPAPDAKYGAIEDQGPSSRYWMNRRRLTFGLPFCQRLGIKIRSWR